MIRSRHWGGAGAATYRSAGRGQYGLVRTRLAGPGGVAPASSAFRGAPLRGARAKGGQWRERRVRPDVPRGDSRPLQEPARARRARARRRGGGRARTRSAATRCRSTSRSPRTARRSTRSKFSGRGCAISQAATSMLTEMVQGRTATRGGGASTRTSCSREIGIPLTPVRLKCAMLGLTTLKVALHKAKGTPLPDGLAGLRRARAAVGGRDRRRAGGRAAARLDEARRRRARPLRRRLQLRRHALRDRGPLLARRRAALRGRLGPGDVHGRLPAPRLGVRARRPGARCRCRPTCRSRRSRCRSWTG